MRCTATAEIANELKTKAAVRNQNALEPTAASKAAAGSAKLVGASPGTTVGVAAPPRRGAARRKTPCKGTVAAARMTANVISALRQPCSSISQFDSGEKTKLANPPTSVTAVNACRRRSWNHFVTTVKAAS